ncbi:LOW QUALITY PROTEIN: hypothetical protein V1477_013947 [Vespula maculifrons]|uniref:Uncharacterized protein n=1 Tax=Vespula maculifrons TaxID=7453 RepID=A0ABD2BL56_VESMC
MYADWLIKLPRKIQKSLKPKIMKINKNIRIFNLALEINQSLNVKLDVYNKYASYNYLLKFVIKQEGNFCNG